MEDKIEKLLLSQDIRNSELALILAKNEKIEIADLPAVKWIVNHLFKIEKLPKTFSIDIGYISTFMAKKTVSLSGNLGRIPKNLYQLSHLIQIALDFEGYPGYLSRDISNFEQLNILQIKNYPSKLPTNLHQLKKLKCLELTNCLDVNEQSSIWKMDWLERLELEKCKIKRLPLEILTFKQLDYLSLQETFIEELPNELIQLKKLKFISCFKCSNLVISEKQQELFDEYKITILR